MKKACTTNFPWVFRSYKTGISFKHKWDFKQGIKLIKGWFYRTFDLILFFQCFFF